MIEKIHIENYKSISSLDLELGRVTVLIGENGSGKSNILEAIALASAASQDKLDNEFLGNRGIRVSHPYFMRSAFGDKMKDQEIKVSIKECDKEVQEFHLQNDNQPYSQWQSQKARTNQEILLKKLELIQKEVSKLLDDPSIEISNVQIIQREKIEVSGEKSDLDQDIVKLKSLKIDNEVEGDNKGIATFTIRSNTPLFSVYKFIIYSPENSSLRILESESKIEPLGIKGEGLYKLLKVTAETEPEKIDYIKESLRLIGWFKDFQLSDGHFGNSEIVVKDKYIQDIKSEFYNHKNTNEGFLFLLFYTLLFVSNKTPRFFAIDNVDASLNPKLCTELTRKIVQLAREFDKQVILTTHNPAILDGINLYDEEQKIVVVSRNKKGHTRIKVVKPPQVSEGEIPVKLSEAFLSGMIGGLPKNF